ncbi:MAG: hypothetical protein HOV81_17195 [Kofleriaceae bacterium]|nr:hypothetical protein [Kofleriaceae bacterium]
MRHIGLVVVSCALAGTAVADEGGGKQKRADELFEQGRKLLNAAPPDPAGACEKFNEAIKLDPDAPGTMLNLGLCNEKLQKYRTALYWFRKAQARAAEAKPPLPAYEAAAKEHTFDLAGKVATIRIAFATPPPADVRVKIDGDDVKADEYLKAEVDPGPHTLVAGAPGKKIYTEDFTVEGRGGQTITISFVEGNNTVVIDRGAGRRKAAVAIAIGGGVLWGVAGGLSLWAKGKYDNYATNGMPDPVKCGCDELTATDKANHYQQIARWVATPIFGVGVLAVASGIALYVTAPEKERIDRTVFTPVVGPDQVGFAVSGGF